MSDRYFGSRISSDILVRDNHTCIYCGRPATVVDHILSYAQGGTTTHDNGISCCHSCNKLKENDTFGTYLIKGMEYIAGLESKRKGKRVK